MEVPSLCVLLATLSVSPDRSQFFRYDRVVLNCSSTSSGWTVKRTTRKHVDQACGNGWSVPGNSSCTIRFTYPSHTGVYWCETEQGGCSSRVNLTVADRSVILESPAHGVMEGGNVTLRCSYKEEEDRQSTSMFDASFFKDGVFKGTDSRGTLTLTGVSTAQQGFYKCKHPTKGESAESWLAVTERAGTAVVETTPLVPWIRLVCGVLLFLFYNALLVVSVSIYCRWYRAKRDAKNTMI
ncbi:low affinity immunoglobulin gamma Fc region receptor II-b-like [Salarias fasciatus]|uniref:low affinity immunoglobulin gamma Fc region receptor II-b-like n=1 Tax=Salarias fasciatus TaxID=181472 RepID=UPI0011765291|nr:low affinity immunoglobulin gamma Fc region receptor II-b-like [Salarias fasciatus]